MTQNPNSIISIVIIHVLGCIIAGALYVGGALLAMIGNIGEHGPSIIYNPPIMIACLIGFLLTGIGYLFVKKSIKNIHLI